jgi:hypothetical protein
MLHLAAGKALCILFVAFRFTVREGGDGASALKMQP